MPALPDFTIPRLGGIQLSLYQWGPTAGELMCVTRAGARRDKESSSSDEAIPSFMADADIYNLEFLSLVAKITQEVDNYAGVNEKTVAEFIIDRHDKCNSLDAFKAKLIEDGASFPDSFVENVDRLIFSMHPKYKKKTESAKMLGKRKSVEDDDTDLERKKRMFPGLAMQDKPPSAVADDVFLKELGDLVAGKTAHSRPDEDEPSRKRARRSWSPPHRRRSDSPNRMDDHGRSRQYADTRPGRRPSPSYERTSRGRPTVDDKPVLYKIYNGRVSGIREFGAFVTLEGVAGRVEGKSSSESQFFFIDILFRYGSCLKYSSRSEGEFSCRPS